MSEQQVRSVALFFFLVFLDGKKAVDCSARTVSRLRKLINKSKPEISETEMVTEIWAEFQSRKKTLQRGKPSYSTESGWKIPPELDLGAWKEFQKNALEAELIIVVLNHILQLKEEVISQALQITLGTVRYRAGRGLRLLGGYSQGPRQGLRSLPSL
ncbi:MAG: hypothetical protein LW875_03055 [Proteobacteria bacterium]|jgi:hypothetical protein|nr:hypothetical protein [Pseudomonadota bacterium]